FAQQRGLGRVFVDAGRAGRERHAGAGQHRLARGAGGGEHDLHQAMISATWPCLALIRLITAAAVSSTERRVTSITGHLYFSNQRRALTVSSRPAPSSP